MPSSRFATVIPTWWIALIGAPWPTTEAFESRPGSPSKSRPGGGSEPLASPGRDPRRRWSRAHHDLPLGGSLRQGSYARLHEVIEIDHPVDDHVGDVRSFKKRESLGQIDIAHVRKRR